MYIFRHYFSEQVLNQLILKIRFDSYPDSKVHEKLFLLYS